MAVLTFDAFWRDHGAKAGLKGLSKEAKEAAKAQEEFKGKAVAAGALVGAALFKMGKDAIDVASDINESQSKVGVVFGKSAAQIVKASDTSAKAMGISKAAYLDAAGTLGNLFVSMKLPQEQASKMSSKMVQLASDMASFNNADPSETLEALRSGLVGETEPLRKFGVNLNEAAIKAEAMSLGLVHAVKDQDKITLAQTRFGIANRAYVAAVKEHGKGSDEAAKALAHLQVAQGQLEKATSGTIPQLNAAQKAQAAYSLITKQTSTAQGDFARTSDGLANQQRILKATFSDLQGEIGQKLLPVAVKAAHAMVDLLGFISDHQKGVAITAGAVGTLVVAIKGLNAAGTAAENWSKLATAFGRVEGGAGKARGALGKVSGLIGAGGPWGIAAAGAVTLVTALAVQHEKAKKRVDDLADSLNQETGAITKASRAEAAKILQDQGAFEAAKALGISLGDLTDAALGNEAAQKRVNRAIQVAADRYKAMTPEQRASSEWANELARRNTILQDAIGGTNSELSDARRKLAEAKVKQSDLADATADSTKAAKSNADAIAEMNREVRRLPKSKSVTIGAEVKFPAGWAQFRAGERMAYGGPVGDGTGTVDDQPILAMRGEHMWTTREVAGAGGHSAVARIRKAAAAGQLRGYANGGPIGMSSQALSTGGVRRGMAHVEAIFEDAAVQWGRALQKQLDGALGGGTLGGGLGWRRQWAAVHAAFPWATLHSSFRPGAMTVSGNRSYHALGRAIDTDASMQIFDWIRSRYGRNTKELIYSPAGIRQLKDGTPHFYTGAVRAMHWNHVHWAYDQGGVASGAGMFPKMTNAPERILSPRQTSAFEGLVRSLDGGAGGGNTYILNAPNYVGSRAELRAALVDLARSNKLDAILRGRV